MTPRKQNSRKYQQFRTHPQALFTTTHGRTWLRGSQLTVCVSLLCRDGVHTRTDARCRAVVFAGANEAAVVSAGVRTHTCAHSGVLDVTYIIVSTHDTTRNARLELDLARPATKSNGVVARVACRCALGGTLLPFGARAYHRIRIQRNDTASRTHKFAQVDGTKIHSHGRTRPTTKK